MTNPEKSYCVLGRYKREIGRWSWVSIERAEDGEAAIRKAISHGQVHGYYVALPWEIAARGETDLTRLDAEGDRPRACAGRSDTAEESAY